MPNAAAHQLKIICTWKIKCKMERNDKELSGQGRICSKWGDQNIPGYAI